MSKFTIKKNQKRGAVKTRASQKGVRQLRKSRRNGGSKRVRSRGMRNICMRGRRVQTHMWKTRRRGGFMPKSDLYNLQVALFNDPFDPIKRDAMNKKIENAMNVDGFPRQELTSFLSEYQKVLIKEATLLASKYDEFIRNQWYYSKKLGTPLKRNRIKSFKELIDAVKESYGEIIPLDYPTYSTLNNTYNDLSNFEDWQVHEIIQALLFRHDDRIEDVYMTNLHISQFLYASPLDPTKKNIYILQKNKNGGYVFAKEHSSVDAVDIGKNCTASAKTTGQPLESKHKTCSNLYNVSYTTKGRTSANANATSNIFSGFIDSGATISPTEGNILNLDEIDINGSSLPAVNNVINQYGFHMIGADQPFEINSRDTHTSPVFPIMPVAIGSEYKNHIKGGFYLERHSPLHVWVPMNEDKGDCGHVIAGMSDKTTSGTSGGVVNIQFKLVKIKIRPGYALFCMSNNFSETTCNWHSDALTSGTLLVSFGYNNKKKKDYTDLEGIQPIYANTQPILKP